MLNFDEPVAKGEGIEGHARGEENVGAGPDFLVDGEVDVPDCSGNDPGASPGEHGQGLRLFVS